MPTANRPETSVQLSLLVDRVGIVGSTLCAVHCALLPLLLALAPALGLGAFGGADFDQAMAVFAGVLGVTSISIGFRRHRAFRAWAFLLPGLAMLWAGSFTGLHDHSGSQVLLMSVGGLSIAAAHLVNLRLTHRHLAEHGYRRDAG